MSDSFRDYIDPIRPKAAIDRLEHEGGGPPPPPPHTGVRGKVIAVRRSHEHREGKHRLDVTVGADEGTEFVIRVPRGAYVQWEGKDVIIHLEG